MARPREFDPDQAIDKAIEVFWRQGYKATSVQDLVEATGVQRGSLYAAFGSKAGMFDAAMDRYMAKYSAPRLLENEDRPIREALAELLRALVETAVTDKSRRGCFVTNTAVELTPHDRAVAKKVASNLGDLEDVLTRRLADAQARGEVRSDREPRALARFLVGSVQGLRVMSKVTPDRERLRDIADIVLASLD